MPDKRPRRIEKLPIEIWAFTATDLYRGQAHRLAGQRASDVLNDILSATLRGPRTRFVPLTSVTIFPVSGGEPTTAPFVALNKGHLLFVGDLGPVPMAAHERDGDAMALNLVLSAGHEVTGALYRPAGRRVLDIVNDDREFLPLTDVSVRWPAGVSRRFDFVAINKAQITRVAEE